MKNRCPDCCHPEIIDAEACGCCQGLGPVTPRTIFNRPGLSRLVHRIGTHADFLESMQARLSSRDYPALAGLTTRDGDDPAMALLDAWAVVADVLTFYQERIANEGYLRSATERRSILELARLTGYRLQPGVAASVFLAYTLDDKFEEESLIPAGSRVQSVPGPGELPQTFETSVDLKARAGWNNLRPRLSRPQTENDIRNRDAGGNSQGPPHIYLKGVTTGLKPDDPLLIDFGRGAAPEFFRVYRVNPDAETDRTLVHLSPTAPPAPSGVLAQQREIIAALTLPPSRQPRNALRLKRTLTEQFKSKAETGYAAVKTLAPVLKESLSRAAANAIVAQANPIRVYALRRRAPLFGHNVPQRTRVVRGEITIIGDWPIIDSVNETRVEHEEEQVVYLDARYEDFLEGDWIVVRTPETRLTARQTLVLKAGSVDTSRQRSNYGITAPTTRIELPEQWIRLTGQRLSRVTDDDFDAVRATTVYGAPEALELAERPIAQIVCGGLDDPIELDGFYEGLESGRWVIVSGERDLPETGGVRFSELAMLAAVTQDIDPALAGSGEQTHTFITLAEALEYCFRRDTITIYGNVVKATHGETRREVLGSGDGARPVQAFALKQKPLTYTAASNPSGVESTLEVRVNEVLWHETEALAGLTATDRRFITQTDDEDQTTVTFGNGRQGARPPTGVENIKARYRNGIGRPGNVKAGQISLLADKPLGTREVVNPLRASGGADRENREQARKNAPLAVTALDRLVSVKDYEDFARTYAGIGKASAVELSTGRQPLVHVTIAGADDIPVDPFSDLFINLERALHAAGDPFQPVQLAVRELVLLVISARVRIDPDFLWEDVAARLRAALLDAFGFEFRELGRNVYLSEIYAVMQAVRGVSYVDVDSFGGVPEKITDNGERRLLTPDEVTRMVTCIARPAACLQQQRFPAALGLAAGRAQPVTQALGIQMAGFDGDLIHPAQLALLSGDLPDTLILNPIQ
jgi:predicted phage baseplate assembly protein